MPSDSVAHRLGPHVVGTRVVVRRLLPEERGPSGGPAMTDVLGICVRWSDGECVVQPDDGPAVTIPLRLIVSGKPVPPRPSVRHRVSPREAEGHARTMWPHLQTQPIGEWLLRTDPAPVGRLLKRANSCLAMGDAGTTPTEAAAQVVAFYAARERRPLAQVEQESAADRALTELGWSEVPGGASYFQLGSVARASRSCTGAEPDEATSLELLEDGPRAELRLVRAGRVVVGGRAALDGDWLGVHSLTVEPWLRRKGLAISTMRRLLEWGAERGASTTWLHVEVDNEPALAFYDRLGYRTHHALRYLTPDAHPSGTS